MSPQATLDLIKQLTDDLATTYETQAELVAAEMEASRGRAGEFQEWECSAWLCTTGGYYSETKPSGWDEFLHFPNLSARPHSRQGEAMDELQAAEEEYNTTDTEQLSRQEKLARIPTDIGGFLMDWFSIDADFAQIYYAANKNEIPASGEAWLSSSSGAYDSAIGTQRTAADTARDVTGGLVENTSAFLSEITDSVTNLADLALEQEQLYLDTIGALIEDYTSISGFISAAKNLAQLFLDSRQYYFDQVQEQGRQLASAVDTVIQVGLLENDLTGIGPGGNWPTPNNVQQDPDNPAWTPVDEIRTDLAWFKSHVDHWDEKASEMETLKGTADSAASLPVIMIDMPHFSAAQSTSLNGLADDITAAINGGRAAAEEMSSALTDTIRNYVENETSSAAEADALFNEYFG